MRVFSAAVSLGVFGLLVFAVGGIEGWVVRPPACLMKSVTGIPCPGCGGTRALGALSRGELGEAFALNPLVGITAVVLVGWLLLAGISRLMPAKAAGAVEERLGRSRRGLGVLAAVTAAAHWVYLILFLK